jgi:alpha-glucosidase (family GH31 glycosyl hydrolase)
MEYEFPHNGYESVTDQFMLGKDILVAPVCEKGVHTRKVILPNGNWKYIDGIIYRGSTTVTVDAPLSVLPYFEKVN